ncbi:class D sortase [Paenibacillus sp. P96]|uniref:Class D sortase n=1 Tax=Paenibacillus zeirhizosphaerae TaxID=2987519 RepID=A0ABT9FQS6_9BACL|nr:class D sortase [Paenibacillus sp. P96]MDP4097071.1 class D sortase [Paenibacillus sp. P96]
MRKLLPYLLILLGVLIIIAPKLIEQIEDHKQNELMQKTELWEAQQQNNSQARSLASEFQRASRLLEETEAVESEPIVQPELLQSVDGKTPIAVIEIPVIDVKLPVLEGATEENMRHAAVHMTGTAELGAVGNTAVAAHRARTEGRLFNRLDEVKMGDTISVSTPSGSFIYTVDRIKVVEPTDLSVLSERGQEAILTLITCTPGGDQRLIVQAKL